MTAFLNARALRAAAVCLCAGTMAIASPAPVLAEGTATPESTRTKTAGTPMKIKNTRSAYVCSPAGFGQKSRCYHKG